jgi:hypothetical protein
MKKQRNYRQVTNAFGDGSPTWNLAFPRGNLTAAEITAYCPHWLKSIDVIDRFVSNGGKSQTIAAMINEFRDQPNGNTVFHPNSVCRMMQYAMRRSGFDDWSVGKHFEWRCVGEGLWNETSLDVSDFRTPRITHPNGKTKYSCNKDQKIQFSDLVLHVKKHPSGFDALDLTRCVLYAVEHPEESWVFPDDFEKLVNKLGGPTKVFLLHCDRQIFSRRSAGLHNLETSLHTPTTEVIISAQPNKKIMARTRSTMKADHNTATSLKRGCPNEDIVTTLHTGSGRRSERLATKVTVNLYDSDTDHDSTDKDISYDNKTLKVAKKRKLDDSCTDGDFVQPDNATSSDESIPYPISGDEEFTPPPARKDAVARKGRVAAEKALQTIKTIAAANNLKPKVNSTPDIPIDPVLMKTARDHSQRKHIFLKPPVLSRGRLVVDELSVHLYAAPDATDLWKSALSSSRFNGPRRHPPFRELHRLTDPSPLDDSDWAENIRWAKEQEKMFGSKTWTEYDYHLECITEHRRKTMWVSKEAIQYG